MSASGSRQYMAVAREIVSGTVNPSPTLYKKRHVAGVLTNAKDTFESGELRSDRSIVEIRTGNDQPEASLDTELSFGSFDDLFSWGLGNDIIGGYNFEEAVDFGDATNTIATNDNSSWTDKGVQVGGTLYINGANTPANDGIYVISAISDGAGTNDLLTVLEADGVTAPSFTVDAADTITIVGGWYTYRVTTETGVTDLTVDNTAKTMTLSGTGTPTWDLTTINPGDWVIFNGFTNAGNNDVWFQIDTVTSTVITFESTTTLVDETVATATDIDFTSGSGFYGSIAQTGQTLPTFTLSEFYEDISEGHYSEGCKISSFSQSYTTGDILTGTFSILGQTYSPWSATEIPGSTVVDTNTAPVMDAFEGDLFFYDPATQENVIVPQCVITSLDYTYDNSLEIRSALFQRSNCEMGEGRQSCTGSMSLYFGDSTYADYFDTETILTAKVRPVDNDGNAYTFVFPRLKFTSENRTLSESDVTQDLDWQALGGDSVYGTMGIISQPAMD